MKIYLVDTLCVSGGPVRLVIGLKSHRWQDQNKYIVFLVHLWVESPGNCDFLHFVPCRDQHSIFPYGSEDAVWNPAQKSGHVYLDCYCRVLEQVQFSLCGTLCYTSRAQWALLKLLFAKDVYISDWIFMVHIKYLLTFSLPINLECNQCIGLAGVTFLREHLNMCGNKITDSNVCQLECDFLWLIFIN